MMIGRFFALTAACLLAGGARSDVTEVCFAAKPQDIGRRVLSSGQTVIVPKGSVLRGSLVLSGVTNVIVKGAGVLEPPGFGCPAILIENAVNVRIEGLGFRYGTPGADDLRRGEVPNLFAVRGTACDLSFSDLRLVGGPSRCLARLEADVDGSITGVKMRNLPEGLEIFSCGIVESDIPLHHFGNGYRKFLLFGWENGCGIAPELLARKAPAFAASGVEGTRILATAKDRDGTVCDNVMDNAVAWRKEAFRAQIPAYRKAVSQPGLRHSFMGVFFRSPRRRLAWTDDAAWARVGKSMAVSAWFARQTGLRGCLLDYEDYPHQKQFLRLPGDPPYDALAPLVRRRAREAFAGVFREYPEAAILSFWLLSIDRDYFRTASAVTMARDKGDLWPSVVNGILDAMPPGARLIDGNEEGYRFFAERGDFNRSSVEQRDRVIDLIAPENRAKYRAQARVGFGLYLDEFENPEFDAKGRRSAWYRAPSGGSRTGGFAKMAYDAAYASSEYVWLWNERRPWIDWEKPLPKQLRTDMTRVEKLKGVGDVLRALVDPETYAFRRIAELKAEGQLVQLAPDWMKGLMRGDGFVWANDASKVPPSIGLYLDKKDKNSRFGVDFAAGGGHAQALRAEGAKGCFLYSVKGVAFGEYYAVRASKRGRGTMMVGWKRNTAFDWTLPTYAFPFESDGSDWGCACSTVRVPDNCDEMVVLMNFDLENGESVWFDDQFVAKVFAIPPDATK